MRWAVLLIPVISALCGAAEPERKELAEKAEKILRTFCYRCHGQDGAVEGGFNYVLDVSRLVTSGKVVPGKPDHSPIWKRLAKDSMPPAGEEPRPTENDKAVLRAWIEAGAPAASEIPQRQRISDADVHRWILDDLRQFDRRARRFQRYFSLVPQYHAGLSLDELQTYRHALSKLVNSLSWSPRIRVPVGVGPDQLLLRIDLRWYMWDSTLWNRLLAEYPYGIVTDGSASRSVMAATATKMPVIRADWFVATACRPPLYFDLLQLPGSVAELERQLRVDVLLNIQQQRVARAGFNGSGISKNNRIIERHESIHGAYWRTYDFEAIPQNLIDRPFLAPDQRNIFAYPLGPAGASPREPFLSVGGEVIFSLPNGLHGYMLYNAAGNRIDKGPVQIVSDPKRPDRAVETGISCLSCHLTGINPKSDQIRDFVAKNPQVFSRADTELIRGLYVSEEIMNHLMQEDMEKYRQAVAQTGAKIGKSEPVSALTLRYEADLDLRTAAAEVSRTPQELREAIQRSSNLSRSLGALQVPGGSIARPLWVQTFADLAKELRLGFVVSSFGTAGNLPDNTGDLDPLEGPGQLANAAVISRDGRRAFIAAADRTARVWDVPGDREIRRMIGHAASVWCIALSPDSQRLATGGMDGTVRIWSLDSGAEVKRWDGHLSLVSSLVWTPDGSRLISAGQDGEVIVWDVATGVERARWSRPTDVIQSLALSPSGQKLFVALSHEVLSLDTQTMQKVQQWVIGHNMASSLSVNPTHGVLALGTDSGQLLIWNPEKDAAIASMPIEPGVPILSLDWAPSGKALAVGLGDRTVRLVQSETGQVVGRFEQHAEAVVAVAFVNSGRETISISRDSTVRRWRLTRFTDLTVAQDAASSGDTDSQRRVPTWEPSAVIPAGGWIDHLRLSADGRWLYFLDRTNHQLVQIDTETLQKRRSWNLPRSVETYVTVPKDGAIWLVGEIQGQPKALELDARELKVRRQFALEALPYDLAVSEAGLLFLSGREPGWSEVTIYDIHKQAVVGRWSGLWSRSLLQMSPDQKRLFVGSQGIVPGRIESYVLPVDLTKKPQPLATLTDERTAPAGPFSVSPDGQFIIARNGAVFRAEVDRAADLSYVGRVASHLDVVVDPTQGALWLLAADGRSLKKYAYPDLRWQTDFALGSLNYRMTGDTTRRRLYVAGIDAKSFAQPRVREPVNILVFDLK